MISISGRANVTRNNVHPNTSFMSEYFAFTYPSTGGVAYGDSFRITLDGTNFGANFSLNNSYSYFSRGGRSRGATIGHPHAGKHGVARVGSCRESQTFGHTVSRVGPCWGRHTSCGSLA